MRGDGTSLHKCIHKCAEGRGWRPVSFSNSSKVEKQRYIIFGGITLNKIHHKSNDQR